MSSLEAEQKALAALERTSQTHASEARSWALNQRAVTLAGEVQDKITNDPQYDKVLECVLSDRLHALCVTSAEDAEDLVDAIHGEGLKGTLDVLVDGSRTSAPAHDFALSHDCVALVDVVHPVCGFEQAIAALLGDVVLVDSCTQAFALAKQASGMLRFATLAGDVLGADGVLRITGVDDELGALARRRRAKECADELDKVKEQCSQLVARRDLVRAANDDAKTEALASARTRALTQGDLSAAQTRVQEAQSKLSQAERACQDLLSLCEELKQKREQAKPLVEELQANLSRLEEASSDLNERLSVAQRDLEALRSSSDDLVLRVQQAHAAFTAAESAAALARSRVMDRRRDIADIDSRRSASELFIGQKAIIAARLEEPLQVIGQLVESMDDLDLRFRTGSVDENGGLAARVSAARQDLREKRAHLDNTTTLLADLRVEHAQLEIQVKQAVSVITTDCEVSLDYALTLPALDDRPQAEERAAQLKRRIVNLGSVNPDAAVEYEQVKRRFDFLQEQLDDLEHARTALSKIDEAVDKRMKRAFLDTFTQVNTYFGDIFATLFPGGHAELVLVDPTDIEHTGVEVVAQPKGKSITKMSLMSGGEKSLVALALLFAVYKTRTTPFYILDEVEAALDDSNLRRLLSYIQELRQTTQLIMITHQRRTMESADVLFGVSMHNDGVTKIISQRLERAVQYAED